MPEYFTKLPTAQLPVDPVVPKLGMALMRSLEIGEGFVIPAGPKSQMQRSNAISMATRLGVSLRTNRLVSGEYVVRRIS